MMGFGHLDLSDLDAQIKENRSKEEKPKKVIQKEVRQKIQNKVEKKEVASNKVVASKKKVTNEIVSLDPNKITPWKFDDRSNAEIEREVGEMIKSIQLNKQKSPILVRSKKGGGYEEIFGRVRLEACKSLGINVLATIEDLSDRDAAAYQVVENGDRSDISAWSKAVSYLRYIDEGLFPSVTTLAARCNRPRTSINSLVSLARNMPENIVGTFDLTVLGQNALEFISAEVRNHPAFFDELKKHQLKIDAGDFGVNDFKRIFSNWRKATGSETKKDSDRRTISGQKGDYFTISKNNNGALLINFLKRGRELMTEEEIVDILKSAMDKNEK